MVNPKVQVFVAKSATLDYLKADKPVQSTVHDRGVQLLEVLLVQRCKREVGFGQNQSNSLISVRTFEKDSILCFLDVI